MAGKHKERLYKRPKLLFINDFVDNFLKLY